MTAESLTGVGPQLDRIEKAIARVERIVRAEELTELLAVEVVSAVLVETGMGDDEDDLADDMAQGFVDALMRRGYGIRET